MATTWIKPIHQQRGKSVSASIKSTINYIIADEKTNNGQFLLSRGCEISDAHNYIDDLKFEYERRTGRSQENPILCYHVRQAFAHDEITPETALEIGNELALQIINNNYAYIVATHVDKKHIHNHILIGAYNDNLNEKFFNPYFSYNDVRKISDEICSEYGLSIIENPQLGKDDYTKKEEYKNNTREMKPTNRNEIENYIEIILSKFKPITLEKFYKHLNSFGVEIRNKSTRGQKLKHTVLRIPGQKKATRWNKLSDDYREENIILRIQEYAREYKQKSIENWFNIHCDDDISDYDEPTELEIQIFNEIIEEEREVEEKQKAEDENENELLTTSSVLVSNVNPNEKNNIVPTESLSENESNTEEKIKSGENNINEATLDNRVENKSADEKIKFLREEILTLDKEIRKIERSLKDNKELQLHLGVYAKTQPYFDEYQRQNKSRDYYRQNETAIENFKNAKEFLDKQGTDKFFKPKELEENFTLLQAKNNQNIELRENKLQLLNELIKAQKSINRSISNDVPSEQLNRIKNQPTKNLMR